jgi:hypothetical protein
MNTPLKETEKIETYLNFAVEKECLYSWEQ